MLKKIVLPLLFLSVALVPAFAAAQHMPHGKWWKDPKVVAKLDLSESQVDRLDNAFQQSRRKLIKLKSDVEAQRFELDTLIDGDILDEAKINTQFDKLKKAQQALGAERFQFILEIRKIVGPEKFSRIKAMVSKSRHSRFGKDRMMHPR